MTLAEIITNARLKILKELEDEQRRIAQGDEQTLPPEVLKAKQTIAQFEQRNRDRIERAQRLQGPPLGEEDCPRCQSHGNSVQMRPQTDADGEHLRCGKCEYEIEIPG